MATPTQKRRRARLSLVLGTLFAALTLGAVFAYADTIMTDGDTAAAAYGDPLAFGSVCSATAVTKAAAIAINRNGNAGSTNVFKNGSTATVSAHTPLPSGISGVTFPSGNAITLPSDWGSQPNNSKSNPVTADVTVNTTSSGTGTLTFDVTGVNSDNDSITRSQTLSVSWTTTVCPPADNAPPTSQASAANADSSTYTFGEWTRQNVTVTLSATDTGGSGLKEIRYSLDGVAPTPSGAGSPHGTTYNAPFTVGTEGTTTLKWISVDNVGNAETPNTASIMIDKTGPSVNCGSADGNWHGSDVEIICSASDARSGLADAAHDGSFSLSTSVASGTETSNASTGSRTVYDAVGNSTLAGPVSGNMIDKKDPSVSCGSADGLWHASNVSIACTASDGGSGLASGGDASFSLSTTVPSGSEDSNAATGTHNVSDAVGHTVTGGPITGNMIDRKAPDVSCGSADGNWHADDVSIGCTASDDGSGLADSGDASFNLTTNVASGTETSNASTDSRDVADAVGNSATAGPISGNKIDKKGPVVTLTCPSSPILNSTVSGSWAATDGGSGVTAGFGSGSITLDTSTIGLHTAEVAAGASKDNVDNGSGASNECTYSVVYNWAGFFQPIDNNGIYNVVKAGSAVPAKFSLSGNQGLNIFYAAYPKSANIPCNANAPQDTIEVTLTAGNSNLSYDATVDQYVYVWKTDKAWGGTCRQLQVKLVDGTTHTANFNFTR